MTSAADRLVTVRQLYRRRGGETRTTGELVYAVYAGVLVTVLLGVPAFGALASAVAQPAVVQAVAVAEAGRAVAGVGGVGLAAFAALGATRGPALLSPFLLSVLAGNDLPRHRTLLRPFVIATVVLALAATAVAVLLGGALVLAGVSTAAATACFAVAAASFGVQAAVVWLTGQRLGSTRASVLAGALLTATLLTLLVPGAALLTPWGWLGLSWPVGAARVDWAPALLGVTALIAAGFVPVLLDGLRGPALLSQAQRWHAAEIATGAADYTGALATYRAKPQRGRSWRAVTGTRLWPRFFLRDLLGTLRTPGRLVVGTASLVLGGFVTAHGLAPSDFPAWAPIATGAGISYAGLGVLADGFRHAADTAAAPPLYRYSTAQLYGLHALLPSFLAVACTVLGASIAASVWAAPRSLLGVGLLAVFLLTVRAYDSAKGPLPPSLLTPVPTPGGDLSSALVLAWQADAVLISVITASAALATGASTVAVIAIFAVAILGLVALTRQRLRNLP